MEIWVEPEQLESYKTHLMHEERSDATINKYMRDIHAFLLYVDGRPIDKERIIAYKRILQESYKVSSVNSMLAAINSLLAFLGHAELQIKQLKVQQRVYCPAEVELTKAEYKRLVAEASKKKNMRLRLVMETICSTGIRVSELPFITVEAVVAGEAVANLKGKTRIVFLPPSLRKMLLAYIHKQHMASGPVFVTRSGKPLNRSNIWRAMKDLCQDARVERSKVFPHNLRHLFARTYYKLEKDLSKLADILGHSCIETTRLYTITSGTEHCKQIAALGLVV